MRTLSFLAVVLAALFVLTGEPVADRGTSADDFGSTAIGTLQAPSRTVDLPSPHVSFASMDIPTVQYEAALGVRHPGEPRGSVALDPDEVIQAVCARCHNDRRLLGNLSLEGFELEAATENGAVAERMIRKLRAGMMPPPNSRPPAGDTLADLVVALETAMDEAASQNPNPGVRVFQRMNRAEYEASIQDLFGIDVQAEDWLPLDQKSANFDNIADAQALSPTLLEAYLNAAAEISRMVVGDVNAPALNKVYSTSTYTSQHPWDWVEGAPFGTRGGLVTNHVFPADAEYTFELSFGDGGDARREDIDFSIDGEQVALLHYERGVPMITPPIRVTAGQHKVSVAFVRRTEGPYEDLIRPHTWSYAGGGDGGGSVTEPVHVEDVIVGGPFNATGVSDNPIRDRVFTCRPESDADARPCAREILSELGARAYRRPLEDDDVAGLMTFFDDGYEKGGFEVGVRTGLEAILASPHFVFRIEREPDSVAPGESYRISDMDLASRLSFFLWGTIPDDELRAAAESGALSDDSELERQARRMLQDPKADALGSRFAYQWLRLQDLYKVRPDPNYFPNFDENLADAMVRETELFFTSAVRENKGFLELLTADYTYANDRLARHYGLPGIAGDEFRKVEYPDETRRGLLGHGSVLVLTSYANRTSPVLRGKWVMEVLMGTPPPPPPPGVPELEETAGAVDGRILTTRERMEIHRENPTCNACHRFMDPIGLALDNFDVTGKWRMREEGSALDTRGDFYDGTPVSSPSELAAVLLTRPLPLVRSFTENLMAYALGRRVEHFDQPTVRQIVREAEEDGYRIPDLIMGVIRSDAFQRRRATVAASETTGESGLR